MEVEDLHFCWCLKLCDFEEWSQTGNNLLGFLCHEKYVDNCSRGWIFIFMIWCCCLTYTSQLLRSNFWCCKFEVNGRLTSFFLCQYIWYKNDDLPSLWSAFSIVLLSGLEFAVGYFGIWDLDLLCRASILLMQIWRAISCLYWSSGEV